jgi:hypothetical protein
VVNWFTQKMDGGRFYFTASIPDLHISAHTTLNDVNRFGNGTV